MVELLSVCPLPDGTAVDEQQQQMVDRLVAIAKAIDAEAPLVQRDLARMTRRLRDIECMLTGKPPEEVTWLHAVMGRCARQSYDAARALLTDPAWIQANGELSVLPRLHAHVFRAQQQYAAATTVAETWRLTPGIATRCRQRLREHQRWWLDHLPPYFASPAADPASAGALPEVTTLHPSPQPQPQGV
jgi:hypothetical protein